MSKNASLAVHCGVLVPPMVVLSNMHESRLNVKEIRAYRNTCGVSLRDRMRKYAIKQHCSGTLDVKQLG